MEKLLTGMEFVWGQGKAHRLLNVKRDVADSHSLIKNRDNLVGGFKPIKEVLARMSMFINDSDEWLTFDIFRK